VLAARPLVSVVVPVLDEADGIDALLDHLAALDDGALEVIVVDGGSRDGTAGHAERHPSAPRVLRAGLPGRASQQNAGAAAARGELVVFLHADSRLPGSAIRSLRAALRDPGLLGGNFALRFDGRDPFSRALTVHYRIQRRFGVYYGDSTLWLRRSSWDALGGFAPLPIMEDYDLVRRLERAGRTACLPGPARTSSRRWLAAGVGRTFLVWVAIRWLWIAGVPAERLVALYRTRTRSDTRPA
jgi:rSAM/selenodomain-associated transferase 2